jgi:Arc/MetJ-type ribon-helix-helix transcriptional regulator
MATRELTLPPDVAAQLDARVASGEATDVIDVMRAALAALEAQDARKLEDVRAKIARSVSDPRPSVAAGTVFDRVEEMLDSLQKR